MSWGPSWPAVESASPKRLSPGSCERSQRVARYDWEKKFAYPAPRTYKFSEIVTPDAGYVLGVDSTARTAQNMQYNGHSMSGLRLATAQREAKRGAVTGLMLEMKNNPQRVSAAPDMVVDGRPYPAVNYQGYIVAFDAQMPPPAAQCIAIPTKSVWALVLSAFGGWGGVE